MPTLRTRNDVETLAPWNAAPSAGDSSPFKWRPSSSGSLAFVRCAAKKSLRSCWTFGMRTPPPMISTAWRSSTVRFAASRASSMGTVASASTPSAAASSSARASFAAMRQPAAMVCGCTRASMSFSASRSSSPHNTATDVVPSPTSSSCVLAMSTKTLAAALSMCTLRKIVAPSFVTSILWSWLETDCRILSMPLGPSVDFTKSAIAMAPTNDAIRAFSPFSMAASSLMMLSFIVSQAATRARCCAEK
mmetsp:Transcript_26387/g.82154  ORF Transcript_26387/g.82154 Transcript_26387/m.82154 type:complete len:248 (+) Transcript_26387:1650-2393(+)